jgi:hypothetical protein
VKLIDQIIHGRRPLPRRTVIHGTQGVGKTTWAAGARSPIFVPTEDGLNDIECPRFPLAKTYQQVEAAIGELYTQAHDFKTVVIDSADWLERLIHTRVCAERKQASIEDFGYGRGYTFALIHWRSILEGLDALREKRGMAVVVIAHSKIERFENPESDSYDRYVPRLHRSAAQLLTEWADEVLFATWRVHTRTVEEGFGRQRTKGIGTGERVLKTTERPSHIAKNRLGLPDELPLDWKAYAAFLPSLTEVPMQQPS